MGGAAKAVGKAASTVGRGVSAGLTLGGSEIARKRLGTNNPLSMALNAPGTIFTAGNSVFADRMGNQGAPDLAGFQGGQDPATLLAQTGGAPVLANIAMGVKPEDALAGYFGKSTQDGSWDEFLGTLNQKDLDAVRGVSGQLQTIQSNRDLRQQAVDKVMNDFPNIAKQSAQARAEAGGEFDEVTKGYMQQALGQTAAKYAAGGSLSSGAANEAFAKTGADLAMNKLDYMGQREQNSYGQGLNEFNTRLGEVNALRDFQNTMLTGQVQQGFSAQQANLQRQFQGQQFNAEQANQRYLSNQQSDNAMYGALGSLGGTALGGYMMGGFGGAAKLNTSNVYGGGGYGNGPGINTSQYKPINYGGF